MGISASAPGSDAVSAVIDKEKKRAKKCCCLGCGFSILSICCVVGGIALIAYFASALSDSYSGSTKARDAGLTYFGISLLILGLILLMLGVVFCVFLCIAYKRLKGPGDKKTMFQPRSYPVGAAPYPQQDWGDVPNPHVAPTPQVGPSPNQGVGPDQVIVAEVK